MANIRKTFNFRNGVQVDEDNLIVNSLGLVGIGTSVPTELLDVRGTAKIVGLVTATEIITNSLNVGGQLGIATINSATISQLTAGNVSVSTGIVTAASGVVTYYGDGSGLYNIPTSQWVDVDPAIFPGVGAGYSSIYAAGTVGIATNVPRSFLQIGGDPHLGESGIGINSTGDITATGIISATNLRGEGSLISGINASNISSGTLNNSRLPSNLNISGISTFSQQLNVNQNLVVGGTLSVSTITSALTINQSLSVSGVSTFSGSIKTNGSNIKLGDGSEVVGNQIKLGNGSGSLDAFGDSADLWIYHNPSYGNLLQDITGTGVEIWTNEFKVASPTDPSVTVFSVNPTSSTELYYGSVGGSSSSKKLETLDAGVTITGTTFTNQLNVSGISTLGGEVTLNSGIIPSTTLGSYIGTTGKPFGSTYIRSIAIGNGFPNKIESLSGSLLLSSANNEVNVDASFSVTGITTLSNTLNITNSILPVTDLNPNLGSASKRFNQAHISSIQVGVALSNQINTINSTDLILDSATGSTFIDDNLRVSGISTFTGLLNVNQNIIPTGDNSVSIGTSTLRFKDSHIGSIRLGISNPNAIDTSASDLILNSFTGKTRIQDDLYVSGIGSFDGRVSSGVMFAPILDGGADLGSASLQFENGYIQSINSTQITTNTIEVGTGGIVMEAPNGSKYLLSVDNAGNLSTTALP